MCMDTDALRWLQQVADGTTLTEVSELEAVTQSGVSRALARLEAQIGTPLLRRSGRTLRMTHAGAVFKPHLDALLHHLDDGIAAVNQLIDPDTGVVALAFQQSLGTWLVPDLARSFRAAHPADRARAAAPGPAARAPAGRPAAAPAGRGGQRAVHRPAGHLRAAPAGRPAVRAGRVPARRDLRGRRPVQRPRLRRGRPGRGHRARAPRRVAGGGPRAGGLPGDPGRGRGARDLPDLVRRAPPAARHRPVPQARAQARRERPPARRLGLTALPRPGSPRRGYRVPSWTLPPVPPLSPDPESAYPAHADGRIAIDAASAEPGWII